MKNSIGGIKPMKNKEFNTSKISIPVDTNELDNKFKNIESLLSKLNMQNEALMKRVEDLEAINLGKFINSNSVNSISTLNNTLTESETVEDILSQKISNDVKTFNGSNEIITWKKEMEKSIQILSERVANINLNVLNTILEDRMKQMDNEITTLKYKFEQNLDNTNSIEKSIEKFNRAEKLISELLSQISELKNNNTSWQNEFLNNMNEFNEKILLQETAIEQYEKLEKMVNNNFENINLKVSNIESTINSQINDLENNLVNKTKKFDEGYKHLYDENLKLNKKFKDESVKMEVSLKALWDSLAMFTSGQSEY